MVVCLEGSGLTKYSNSKCLTAESGGKWQSLRHPSWHIDYRPYFTFSILLSNLKAPIVGDVSVRCGMTGSIGEGTIEAGGKGTVTVAKYEEASEHCSGETNCETVEKLEGYIFRGLRKYLVPKVSS